jgi:hypothetical protein
MLTQQHNNSESFPQGGYLVFYARATTQDEYFHIVDYEQEHYLD